MSKYEHVFSPIKIGKLLLKNRIEIPPMLPLLASPQGYVTIELIEYYRNLAKGGAGIVTVGDSSIDLEYGRTHYGQLNLGDDGIIPGLFTLVEEIERYGAIASIEINHPGKLAQRELIGNRRPLDPSKMDKKRIKKLRLSFLKAIERCSKAGFRMIMLHGAHGQLLAQFLSGATNKRQDEYGGSLRNRARFALEVLEDIREKFGEELTIEYRISGDELIEDGCHEKEVIEFLKIIEDFVDLIHVSLGVVSEASIIPFMSQPTYLPHMFNVERAFRIKKEVKKPVTCVGSILTIEEAERIIKNGKADIVAMGRAHLADPEIVKKAYFDKEDETRPCLRCNTCGDRIKDSLPIRCAVNPTLGRERILKPVGAKKKNILIIGGGPAGMEAAIVASSKNHNVILCEKEEELGGNLRFAAAFSFKKDMKSFLEWIIRRTKGSNIELRLSTIVSPEFIRSLNPDSVIIACGAEEEIPMIEGMWRQPFFLPHQIFKDKIEGKRIVILGAGLTGCETALELALMGKKITVIDRIKEWELLKDVGIASRMTLLRLLREKDVKFIFEAEIKEIKEKGLSLLQRSKEKEVESDAIIIATGLKPKTDTISELRSLIKETYIIGDALKPRNIMAAIHEGYLIAMEL